VGQIDADSCERDASRNDDDDPLGYVQPVYQAHGATMPGLPSSQKRRQGIGADKPAKFCVEIGQV
jgi:hypothetical protein